MSRVYRGLSSLACCQLNPRNTRGSTYGLSTRFVSSPGFMLESLAGTAYRLTYNLTEINAHALSGIRTRAFRTPDEWRTNRLRHGRSAWKRLRSHLVECGIRPHAPTVSDAARHDGKYPARRRLVASTSRGSRKDHTSSPYDESSRRYDPSTLSPSNTRTGLWLFLLGSPLADDRPIINARKHRVVSGVVRTNRTMVSFNTDTNRTGVLAVVNIGYSSGSCRLKPCPKWQIWGIRVEEFRADGFERLHLAKVETTGLWNFNSAHVPDALSLWCDLPDLFKLSLQEAEEYPGSRTLAGLQKRPKIAATPECKSGGKTRYTRENPPTSDIVRHDSHVRKSGSDPAVGVGTQSCCAQTSRQGEPGFRAWESCRSAGFLGDLPFPLTLRPSAAPYPPRFALVASQDHGVMSRWNSSTLLHRRRLSVVSEGDERHKKLHLDGFISAWLHRQTDRPMDCLPDHTFIEPGHERDCSKHLTKDKSQKHPPPGRIIGAEHVEQRVRYRPAQHWQRRLLSSGRWNEKITGDGSSVMIKATLLHGSSASSPLRTLSDKKLMRVIFSGISVNLMYRGQQRVVNSIILFSRLSADHQAPLTRGRHSRHGTEDSRAIIEECSQRLQWYGVEIEEWPNVVGRQQTGDPRVWWRALKTIRWPGNN
ncbi:hypothetical protein PR048_031228 [Dryococelus australis]|uniref:Uncharacterized protein n=1 Tax=Dryococelus australis TaxID=614101 RepID=A0ABQ9G4Q0_9NEOP|nr:hypothetical protein PR048_031228 [Dryococelus australis]